MVEEAVGLRAATAGDAAAIAAVFLASRQQAMPYLPTLYTDAEVLRWIERLVLPRSHVLLATLDGEQVVGFAAIQDSHLDHLYVPPSAQGSGVGARLLAAAKEASPHGLRLHVFQRNARARLFYERRDFRPVELRDGSRNEEHEPEAVYEWRP